MTTAVSESIDKQKVVPYATAEMSPEYRDTLIQIMGYQMCGEFQGAQLYGTFLLKAPDLRSAYTLSRILFEEGEHGQSLSNLIEELGEDPDNLYHELGGDSVRQTEVIRSLCANYGEWDAFVVVGPFLSDSLGIPVIGASRNASYLPYRDAVRRNLREEGFHINWGREQFYRVCSTPAGRDLAQRLIDEYFPLNLGQIGRSTSKINQRYLAMGLRDQTVPEMRQGYIEMIREPVERVGLRLPDISHILADQGQAEESIHVG